MTHPVRIVAGLLLATGVVACERDTDPRPQLVLIIDTDAPSIGQAEADPQLSTEAAVDTLRIDVLDAGGTASDLRMLSVGDVGAWPVSLGVAAVHAGPSHASSVRLRLRAFARAFAEQAQVGGSATLEPPPGVTIERVVDLPVPTDGVEYVRVVLASDCRGTPSSYLDPALTCVDGERLAAVPTEGIERTDEGALHDTILGTSPLARVIPCSSAPVPGRVCVQGGMRIVGDHERSLLTDVDRLASTPVRAVVLSPFWLDTTELTVGRMRELVADGFNPADISERDPANPERADCTWSQQAGELEDYAVNCVTWGAARAACEAAGGDLPTEAQWEHAARGCGTRQPFPWGDAPPVCCTSSASRGPGLSACGDDGMEPVRSHEPNTACGGLGDLTCAGVHDLAGGVAEATVDAFRPYDAACWDHTLAAFDPVCVDPTSGGHVARGGRWSGRLSETAVPLRWLFLDDDPSFGFRCAYRDK